MTLYVENPKEPTHPRKKKPVKFSKAAEHKINIQKSVFLYTSNEAKEGN